MTPVNLNDSIPCGIGVLDPVTRGANIRVRKTNGTLFITEYGGFLSIKITPGSMRGDIREPTHFSAADLRMTAYDDEFPYLLLTGGCLVAKLIKSFDLIR